MNTVNGYIAIAESGAIRQQSVVASLTETPGLVVTRAYLATKAQRDKATRWKEVVLQTFHAEKCKVITTRFPCDSYQRLQVQHIIQRHKGVPPARPTS